MSDVIVEINDKAFEGTDEELRNAIETGDQWVSVFVYDKENFFKVYYRPNAGESTSFVYRVKVPGFPAKSGYLSTLHVISFLARYYRDYFTGH